jgi:hypothetical protein
MKMKRYLICGIFAGMLLSSNLALAKETAAAKEKAAPPAESKMPAPAVGQTAAQEKEALMANINSLRNADLRVAILQQLLNEEIGKRRNLEAVFCDQYKLDIDKFRKGLYSYDEKEGKFVEQNVAAQEQK